MKNSLNVKTSFDDFLLLMVFLLASITIVFNGYFVGYVSPDASNYLQLAQNLLDGYGYFVAPYGVTGNEREFFAIWPAGYPTLIYLVSIMTGLSVFWASKVLNIILIAFILLLFRVLFHKDAYLYGVVLLFASYLDVFSSTWSETLFITALLWFAVSIYCLHKNESDNNKVWLLFIFVSSLLCFLSRYIGAFTFGMTGLYGLYYFFIRKNRGISAILIGISILNLLIMYSYLSFNYAQTGFSTGMQRVPAPETNIELMIMLIKALVDEALPFDHRLNPTQALSLIKAFFSFYLIPVYLLWHFRGRLVEKIRKIPTHQRELAIMFLLLGMTYTFFIVFMRWNTHFDPINYRLLSPGTLLILVAAMLLVRSALNNHTVKIFNNIIVLIGLISFSSNLMVISARYSDAQLTTHEKHIAIKEKYRDIEPNSIIIFPEEEVRFLYAGLEVRKPYALPYDPISETWDAFLQRIQKSEKTLYLNIPKESDYKRYHESVIKVVENKKTGDLIRLNE